MDFLKDASVVAELNRAWRDSQSDDAPLRHEEGGYIVLKADRTFAVERWRRGEQARITPPPLDERNCYNGKSVVAAFHTHPNPPVDELGREWDQAPSESDLRWHRRHGIRGLIVSRELVYSIDSTAEVSVIGDRQEVLAE